MRSKNVAKNVISSLILQGVTILCGFIVPRLIIQTYGSATNGLINSITQFLAYITLLESGFGPVVKSILYKPIAEKNKAQIERILRATERFFRIIAGVFICYIVMLCFVYPNVVDNQFSVWYTVSLLLIIALSTLAEYFFGMTYTLYLQAKQKTYISSYIQIVTTILVTIIVVFLINIGCSVQIVKLGTAIALILKPLLQNYYVKRKYHINLSEAERGYKIKQKWDGLAQHIAAVVHGNTDIVVLTIFSTMKEVSVYSVYLIVVKGVKNLVQAFNNGIDASFGDMLAKKEHDALKKRFLTYELFYHTVASIIFICTMILITSFVGVYTNGINDVEYIRPVFGVLIVISEFIWAVRLPYSSITLAAGHFKQTMKGAWVEAGLNIVISIILVSKLGIVGVAIGTVIAMLVRTVEFIVHSSRHILKRSSLVSFSWLLLIVIESLIVFFVYSALGFKLPETYGGWMVQAVVAFVLTSAVVVPINFLTHTGEVKNIIIMTKRILKRKEKK